MLRGQLWVRVQMLKGRELERELVLQQERVLAIDPLQRQMRPPVPKSAERKLSCASLLCAETLLDYTT